MVDSESIGLGLVELPLDLLPLSLVLLRHVPVGLWLDGPGEDSFSDKDTGVGDRDFPTSPINPVASDMAIDNSKRD